MNEEKVLSIANLTMSYGIKDVLKGIDLDVYPGQIIGYIGPNGAGKSTTLKIMLGLIGDFHGKITIFGQDISKDDHTYKRRIGYVPEDAEIYESLTASEYLTFNGQLYGLERQWAAEKARLLMDEFEMGNVLHSKISSFSKGMKQKVLIISSLLHDPDLVFLDEPLNGLDANSVVIVKDILEGLAKQGKTIFYSSHIMDVVETISTRIVLLVDGEIIADGSFSELRRLSKQEGSLEDVFNQLTGFDVHKESADRFISIINERNND